jgi:phosphotransferase system enzyme I (PtsI)
MEAELEKLDSALGKSRRQIEEIIQKNRERGLNDTDIIATQLDYFDDPEFTGSMRAYVKHSGMRAVDAVRRTVKELCETFESFEDDPYIKGRSADIADAGERLAGNLTNAAGKLPALPPGSIVVAHDLVPSQTAQLDPRWVLGFVTEAGSATNHTAIMARSMGIAAVVACPGILQDALDGESIIVDAREGTVLVRPHPREIEAYDRLWVEEEKARKETARRAWGTLRRQDGEMIRVAANVGTAAEAAIALEQGAQGIGLFRTEFLFLGRDSIPSEDEQFEAYREAAAVFGSDPVTLRTLDAGGDKSIPCLKLEAEENPLLGFRAIRLCLEHRGLFGAQLRAMLRASVYGNLRIMFPMICTVDELTAARNMVREAMAALDERNIPYKKDIAVGMMVETPAAAVEARRFAGEADFFSIGTNDLTQYTLAADRGNPAVRKIYDGTHPAVLSLIRQTIKAAREAGIPCCLCGELAADSRAIPLLADYGLAEFSVSIDALAKTKETILSLKGIQRVG